MSARNKVLTPNNPPLRGGQLYGFQTDEHYLGANWIDGKPIFRRVFVLGGGNGSTIIDISTLSFQKELGQLIRASFSATIKNSISILVNPETVQLDDVNDLITILHTGVNLLNHSVIIIIEYTKQ